MIGAMSGPWLVCAAIVLLAFAARRAPRAPVGEGWPVLAIVVAAAVARSWWGMWGPLHVNGQGPLWIRGALDAEPLAAYGPGYFEIFSWVVRLGTAPEAAIYAANAALSALSPALLYLTARLAGVERGGAFAAALVLAADPVIVQTAASEGYVSSLVTLVLGTQAALAIGVRAHLRGDYPATASALAAAGLLAAGAARIHPMAYLSLSLSPLVVLGAAQPDGWGTRLGRAAAAGAVVGALVTLTSGDAIVRALSESTMARQAFTGPDRRDLHVLAGLLVALWVLHRWARPPWLPLLGIASLSLMLATEKSFQQHPLWTLNYQRVFLPGMLLGAAPLWPRRVQGLGWTLLGASLAAAVLFVQARPHLGTPTTEQLEHRFLQEVLGAQPPDCTLAAVSRVDKRVWEIPSYLTPTRGPRGPGLRRAVQTPSDLAALPGDGCLLYVRSSLCSSVEGRPVCDAVERDARLERVADRTLPAVPSYAGLPYDRPDVEVVVFRVTGAAVASRLSPALVGDGAAITPAAARSLFEQLAPLRAADGCRLVRFDTHRFRIVIGLRSRAGVEHTMELATAPPRDVAVRTAGLWALGVPAELERECGLTLAAIERVLLGVEAPR